MKIHAWDTETAAIAPGLQVPPMACVTWCSGSRPSILHHTEAEGYFRTWLEDTNLRFVGHNVAYDFAVVLARYPDLTELVFEAYRNNRVTDTMLRQKLLDIAAGVYKGRVDKKGRRVVYKYDLQTLAERCAGRKLQKDAWRLSYGVFLDTPLADWPRRAAEYQEECRRKLAMLAEDADEKQRKHLTEIVESSPQRCTEYALEDALATFEVHQAQEVHVKYLDDQFRQSRAALALHLSSAWGICVDAKGVGILQERIEAEKGELEELLRESGLVRADGTRDTKKAKALMIEVCRAEGIPIIRTDAHFAESLTWEERKAQGLKPKCKKLDGTPLDDQSDECEEHVCLDSDACERTDDDLLIAYAERTTLTKQLSNDIKMLHTGTVFPIHPRYGLAATGRTTSSPNIQNQSTRPGFREAFLARPGFVFVQNDYPTLELYTLAQCCLSWFGYSALAEALRTGDPHLWFAAHLIDKPLEWCVANRKLDQVQFARKLAKPNNFGNPGGMGVKKWLATTRKAVVKAEGRAAWEAMALTEHRAIDLRQKWFEAFPEMRDYFKRVKSQIGEDGTAWPVTLFTNRWRGQATYCATANNGFQALGADCAKNAMWLLAEHQYVRKDSPLFDTRTVALVHDEIIIECIDDGRVHEVAFALAEVMADAANEFLPDIPIPLEKMEPTAMYRWSKAAKQKFDSEGRLIPWDVR